MQLTARTSGVIATPERLIAMALVAAAALTLGFGAGRAIGPPAVPTPSVKVITVPSTGDRPLSQPPVTHGRLP